MSFFGGSPFASPVGQRIEQATDASLASENWALNMEICDIINDTEDGPKDAIKAIRKRLQQNAGKNYTVVMYTLTVLETCVKNCGRRFHVLACNKEFVQELVKLIGPKNDPPTAIQEKVLSLIQSWADAFRHQAELSGVVQVYHDLKQKGIEFPMTDLDTMAPIHTPQRSIPECEIPVAVPALAASVSPGPPSPNITPPPVTSIDSVPVVGEQQPVTMLTSDQLGKLQSELDVVQGNMAVLSEMLSELTPGKEHPSDLELLQELHATCQAMQQRLVELVGKLANDEITAELLRVNDELNNLFLRYKRFENNREASNPAAAAAAAVAAAAAATTAAVTTKNPEAGDSLIDLSEDAVPTSLNTKLAGLSLGSGNATSQLSMINTVPAQSGTQKDTKEKEDKDFDMFAQSRNVTYESSKKGSSSYEDNLEPNQLNGALGAVAQTRSQPVPARAGGTGGAPEESLTSSEFERFLAERAAAAEALPIVTNSTTSTSSTMQGRSHHRQLNKEADSDSSLFAL